MQVPGNWETRGLPDFDGVVWFTRTFDVPQAAAPTRRSSLGRIGNTAEVWVNGLSVSRRPAAAAARRRRPAAAAAASARRTRCRPAR